MADKCPQCGEDVRWRLRDNPDMLSCYVTERFDCGSYVCADGHLEASAFCTLTAENARLQAIVDGQVALVREAHSDAERMTKVCEDDIRDQAFAIACRLRGLREDVESAAEAAQKDGLDT